MCWVRVASPVAISATTPTPAHHGCTPTPPRVSVVSRSNKTHSTAPNRHETLIPLLPARRDHPSARRLACPFEEYVEQHIRIEKNPHRLLHMLLHQASGALRTHLMLRCRGEPGPRPSAEKSRHRLPLARFRWLTQNRPLPVQPFRKPLHLGCRQCRDGFSISASVLIAGKIGCSVRGGKAWLRAARESPPRNPARRRRAWCCRRAWVGGN